MITLILLVKLKSHGSLIFILPFHSFTDIFFTCCYYVIIQKVSHIDKGTNSRHASKPIPKIFMK